MDPLLHERSEWSNACSGPNHDDVDVFVIWQDKGFGRGHEDANRSSRGVNFIGHELRAQAAAGTTIVLETNDSDGQFNEAGVGIV